MRETIIAAGILTLLASASSAQPATESPLVGRIARPAVELPAESAGWDNVLKQLRNLFDNADVVMLGEAHGRKVDSELRLRLVRHPDFSKRARFIVVEFANELQQPVLDRYIQGETVLDSDTQVLNAIPAMFRELFAAIREVNLGLPPFNRVRVLAGSPAAGDSNRTARPVALLREQVLKTGHKALVIYGSGHVWRNEGGITSGLQGIIPGRVFVIETLAPVNIGRTGSDFDALDNSLNAFDAALESRERPVLVFLKNRAAAAKLTANPFYLGQAMLRPEITIGDNDDAIVYFGNTPDVGTFIR